MLRLPQRRGGLDTIAQVVDDFRYHRDSILQTDPDDFWIVILLIDESPFFYVDFPNLRRVDQSSFTG